MQTDISHYSTKDLLRLTESEDDGELAFRAHWTLFKRWDNGIDVSYLIDFITSDVTSDRLKGVGFLCEVSPRVDSVRDAVLKLADDVLAECRRAFAGYLLESGWYDEVAAAGLAKCLQDFDIRVRLKVIDWAILTTDGRFDDFSERVIAASDTREANPWPKRIRTRGIRALTIAKRLREGESVQQIRETVPDEDGFTFDHLSVFEPHYERQRARRQNAQKI